MGMGMATAMAPLDSDGRNHWGWKTSLEYEIVHELGERRIRRRRKA